MRQMKKKGIKTYAVISNNTISENGGDGVDLDEDMDQDYQLVVSPCNNIFGNSDYGIDNDSGEMVDATYNWWGHKSGPGGVGPGSGDEVSGDVDYDPWQSSPCEVVGRIAAVPPPIAAPIIIPGIPPIAAPIPPPIPPHIPTLAAALPI